MQTKRTPPTFIRAAIISRALELKLSSADIAERASLPRQHVDDYLTLRGAMSEAKLARLMAALNLTIKGE